MTSNEQILEKIGMVERAVADLRATVEPPPSPPLIANAGLDRNIQDTDGNRRVMVTLDGRSSSGDIVSYSWLNYTGEIRATGPNPTFEVVTNITYDDRPFTLVVKDASGEESIDTVIVHIIPPLPAPIPPAATNRLMLVVYNNGQRDFFLSNHSLVRDSDYLMIVSGNFSAKADPAWVTQTARRLKDNFPNTIMVATTSGMADVKLLADNLDPQLCPIIMNIWEPSTTNPSPGFPQTAWNRHNNVEVMNVTRAFIQEALVYCSARGFRFWMKPSGRSTPDRGDGGFGLTNGKLDPNKPSLDYGEIGRLCHGQNIQLQGSVDSTNPQHMQSAVNYCLARYARWGVDGGINSKPLFIQTTVGGTATNAATLSQCSNFAKYVWSQHPKVAGVTMWWQLKAPGDPLAFMQARGR